MSMPLIESPHTHGGGDEPVVLTTAERSRRRSRSIAIAVVLAALVLLFYLVTIVKLGPGVMDRPL